MRMRAILLAVAFALALSGTALAQDDESDDDGIPGPDPTPVETVAACDDASTDADYAYCERACGVEFDYADERYYTCLAASGGAPRKPKRAVQPVPAATLATALPLTGTDVRIVALFGLGFLSLGAGIRLRT